MVSWQGLPGSEWPLATPHQGKAQGHRCGHFQKNYPDTWYFDNVIWFDPNSKAKPKKAAAQEQVQRGTKRYLSDDAKEYSRGTAVLPHVQL